MHTKIIVKRAIDRHLLQCRVKLERSCSLQLPINTYSQWAKADSLEKQTKKQCSNKVLNPWENI